MLTDALRVMLTIHLKKNFMGEKKINIMIFFSFFIKLVSKLSKNRLLTIVLRALVSMTLC